MEKLLYQSFSRQGGTANRVHICTLLTHCIVSFIEIHKSVFQLFLHHEVHVTDE